MENEQRTRKPMTETITVYVTAEQKKELHERATRAGMFLDRYIVKKLMEQ